MNGAAMSSFRQARNIEDVVDEADYDDHAGIGYQRQLEQWRRALTDLFGATAAAQLIACEPGRPYWQLLSEVARDPEQFQKEARS